MSVATSSAEKNQKTWEPPKDLDKDKSKSGGDQLQDGDKAVAEIKARVNEALDALAEKSAEVDRASNGEADGVASEEDIKSALASGVFDGDPRKAAVESLVSDPSSARLALGNQGFSASGRIEIKLDDLAAMRNTTPPQIQASTGNFSYSLAANQATHPNNPAPQIAAHVQDAATTAKASAADESKSLWSRLPSEWSSFDLASLRPQTIAQFESEKAATAAQAASAYNTEAANKPALAPVSPTQSSGLDSVGDGQSGSAGSRGGRGQQQPDEPNQTPIGGTSNSQVPRSSSGSSVGYRPPFQDVPASSPAATSMAAAPKIDVPASSATQALAPAAGEVSGVQPAAVQPAAVQPAAVQPAAVQPAAVQPAAVQPALAQQAAPPGAAPAALAPAPGATQPAVPPAARPPLAGQPASAQPLPNSTPTALPVDPNVAITSPATPTAGAVVGLQQARQTLAANFGFLDAAAFSATVDPGLAPDQRPSVTALAASARDGRITRADLEAATRSQMLEATQSSVLSQVAANPGLFDQIDARDGSIDGAVTYSAIRKAQTTAEQDLAAGTLSAFEVPDVRQANYSESLFTTQQSLSGVTLTPGSSSALPDSPAAALLGSDRAAFNALDALDGSVDGAVAGDKLKLTGADQKESLFTALANDGSGRTVLSAAMKSMADDFAAMPRTPLPGSLEADRPRAFRIALALHDNLPKIGASVAGVGQDRAITRENINAALQSATISPQDRASLGELVTDTQAWNWLAGAQGNTDGAIHSKGLQAVVSDFNKANFSGIIMAAGAVRTGVPMKTSEFSGNEFADEMTAEFCADKVFDPAMAEVAYSRLMNDPAIQQTLSEKVRTFTDNVQTRAQQLYQQVTSEHYFDSVSYLENQPEGTLVAEQKYASDLASLGALDPKLAEDAAAVFLQRKLAAEITSATPSSVGAEQMLVATRDVLTSLSLDLRSARGFLRLPGLFAGHDAGWKQIGSLISSWPAEKLNSVAQALSDALIRADAAAGARGAPITAQAVNEALQRVVNETAAQANAAATPLERSRLQGMLDVVMKRAKDVKDIVAAAERNGLWASLAGGISLASGVYKLVKGGENIKSDPWGRLAIANDFVLATCFTPGYLNSANWLLSKMGQGGELASIGMAPSQTFGNLVRAFITGDTAAVGTSISGATMGMALKGLTGSALLAAGTIGGAMGIKQLVDGVRSDEEFDIAAGSLNIAMGTAWTASGVSYLMASAMTGPLIGIGCVFGLAAVFLSMFGPKADNKFADSFQNKLGEFAESGVLREQWRGEVKGWFNENRDLPAGSGMGLDM